MFIFSVIVVALSKTKALAKDIHLALLLMSMFLELKKLLSIHINISSDNHQYAHLNIGAIKLLSHISYYLR